MFFKKEYGAYMCDNKVTELMKNAKDCSESQIYTADQNKRIEEENIKA